MFENSQKIGFWEAAIIIAIVVPLGLYANDHKLDVFFISLGVIILGGIVRILSWLFGK